MSFKNALEIVYFLLVLAPPKKRSKRKLGSESKISGKRQDSVKNMQTLKLSDDQVRGSLVTEVKSSVSLFTDGISEIMMDERPKTVSLKALFASISVFFVNEHYFLFLNVKDL